MTFPDYGDGRVGEIRLYFFAQIDTTVLKISSEGRFTKAEMEVYVPGVDVDALSEALSAMIEINSRIDGGRIFGIGMTPVHLYAVLPVGKDGKLIAAA